MIKDIIKLVGLLIATIYCLCQFTGCATTGSATLDKTSFVTDLTSLTVSENIQIVGLGEASHGTSEFQQLKGEVFKALAVNNNCRIFAIEGDFGGCAKVNEYIHGGSGTAQEAAAQIGFRIYRTQEMADIIEWMRNYNKKAPVGEDLKFYGFDMQRYDNNKKHLFNYLTGNMPAIAQTYELKLASLTDENMYSLDKTTLEQAENDISELILEMKTQKPSNPDAAVQFEYETAVEYAQCILENTLLRGDSSDYDKMRDPFMAQKVEWIVQHEDGLIYINGHNGHIGKQSVSGFTCMGQLLDEQYNEAYFTIGTDAASTEFNAQDDESYKEFKVENQNVFTDQLNGLDGNHYYLEFANVSQDKKWQKVLITQQRMTALNVFFTNANTASKLFYTLKVTPAKCYNGLIVLRNTTPTHLLD